MHFSRDFRGRVFTCRGFKEGPKAFYKDETVTYAKSYRMGFLKHWRQFGLECPFIWGVVSKLLLHLCIASDVNFQTQKSGKSDQVTLQEEVVVTKQGELISISKIIMVFCNLQLHLVKCMEPLDILQSTGTPWGTCYFLRGRVTSWWGFWFSVPSEACNPQCGWCREVSCTDVLVWKGSKRTQKHKQRVFSRDSAVWTGMDENIHGAYPVTTALYWAKQKKKRKNGKICLDLPAL